MKRSISALAFGIVASSGLGQVQFFTNASFVGSTGVSNTATAVGISGSGYALWNPVTSFGGSIGGVSSVGSAGISANGLYIGASAAGGDGRTEIGRYSVATGTWSTYGGMGGFGSSYRSFGQGISSDGTTVFGSAFGPYTGTGTGTSSSTRAIVVQNGSMVDYSALTNNSQVNRISSSNATGTVFGGQVRYITTGTSTADGMSYWLNGPTSRQLVNPAAGNAFNAPTVISASGQYMAGSVNLNSAGITTTINGISTTVRYPYMLDTASGTLASMGFSVVGANGNVVAAPVSGAARVDAFVTGLTADGNTAVGFFRQSFPAFLDKTWGFVWKRNSGMQSIDDYVASLGITSTGSSWLAPTAISPDGQTIIGNMYARGGGVTPTGFMVTTVPEPGTILALAGGIGLLLKRRKKSS